MSTSADYVWGADDLTRLHLLRKLRFAVVKPSRATVHWTAAFKWFETVRFTMRTAPTRLGGGCSWS